MTEGELIGYTATEISQAVIVLSMAVFSVVIAIAEEKVVLYAGSIVGIGLVVFAGALRYHEIHRDSPE
jgi:uncharacterized membrane protein YgdD (TMEM256/DUF423 family)